MPEQNRQAFVVVDLGYGDAGKGTIVDSLTRTHKAHTVIRFNGGAQAAHNVITPDGRHHTFAQFGSGMFVPGVKTYLSRYMLIEPYAMLNEEEHLCSVGVFDAFARTLIDRQALVITPYHQVANRFRERARGANRHGSCGIGVGETVSDSLNHPEKMIRAGDLPDKAAILEKLQFIREMKRAEMQPTIDALRDHASAQADMQVFEDDSLIEVIAENYVYLSQQITLVDETALGAILSQPGTVIFEGAQGVLLDEWYGFAPYTTWSTTTFDNAITLLDEQHYAGEITRMGVLRAYAVRHGAGPFVTEDWELTRLLPEHHNTTTPWQQVFRRGYFDLVASRYALEVVGGADEIALTHVDYIPYLPKVQLCEAYQLHNDMTDFEIFSRFDESRIRRIKVNRPVDLKHQAQLSQYLFQCTPQYRVLPDHNADAYIDAIEERLKVPITLLSYGPTAYDKRVR